MELLPVNDGSSTAFVTVGHWMMTQLGVLVAKGDVTVDEFMLALQYVLEHV